jgi:hypothetical protein
MAGCARITIDIQDRELKAIAFNDYIGSVEVRLPIKSVKPYAIDRQTAESLLFFVLPVLVLSLLGICVPELLHALPAPLYLHQKCHSTHTP